METRSSSSPSSFVPPRLLLFGFSYSSGTSCVPGFFFLSVFFSSHFRLSLCLLPFPFSSSSRTSSVPAFFFVSAFPFCSPIRSRQNNSSYETTGEKGRKKTKQSTSRINKYANMQTKKDKTNVISVSYDDEDTNQPPKRVKVEDNIGVPSSSDFHERLLRDMTSDFIPLRVVQLGEDVVENKVEDLFGIQIVPYGHNFEVW
ncbi:unnamed protein product [Citrullus colocynthis]|uniref:Uncharacterized protein n=1 Tax=Citrullus colocynthis TaxID=252529 RepID=A0ABP0YZZ1_9ROSI